MLVSYSKKDSQQRLCIQHPQVESCTGLRNRIEKVLEIMAVKVAPSYDTPGVPVAGKGEKRKIIFLPVRPNFDQK